MMTPGIEVYQNRVQPDWIDYNGHLNDAYYVVAFSKGLDGAIEAIGMDAAFREQQNVSIFTLQCMTHYFKEINQDEPFTITARLVDADHNKAHLYLQMWHAETGAEHAAFEALVLHMDMSIRRPAPWRAETQTRITQWYQTDQQQPQPDKMGAHIGIRHRQPPPF